MFRPQVFLRIAGDLDQRLLDALRSTLQLFATGRLSDDWDQLLGRRVDSVPGGRVQIVLYRADTHGPWELRVSAEGDPPADAIRQAENEATSAAEVVGLSVAAVWRRP